MPIRLFLVVSALSLGAWAAAGAQSGTADSAAVHRAHEGWFRGLLAEDTAALSVVLATDLTLGFPGGNVMSRAEFLGYLQGGQLFYDSAEHHELRLRVFDDAAVATGRTTLAYRFRQAAGSERLTYTAVYVRSGGAWRMVAWQSTAPPRPR